MVNRRLFRPGFPDIKEPSAPRPPHNGPIPNKKPAPPEITHAENFYWVKQMQSHTPMAVSPTRPWPSCLKTEKCFAAQSSGTTVIASSSLARAAPTCLFSSASSSICIKMVRNPLRAATSKLSTYAGNAPRLLRR